MLNLIQKLSSIIKLKCSQEIETRKYRKNDHLNNISKVDIEQEEETIQELKKH